jgi:mevalonate kinase
MNMVTVSAPGKVILFGEHAVVYGKPALVGAIDKRTFVKLDTRDDDTISINSDMEPYTLSFSIDELGVASGFPYIRKAIELAFENIGKKTGLDIEISSEFPHASGLGSSASVSTATILAVHEALGGKIPKNELAKLGHKVEFEVQGAASPTDTAIATFGGVLFIESGKDVYQKMDARLPLVVGYTGIERSTKVLVENVRALREKSPDMVDSIIENIEKITCEAKERIEKGEEIGELMDLNHGLLASLGVSNFLLDRCVRAARDAGAKGAKLTGAGGGGCMIAYVTEHEEEVAKAIEECGCETFYSVVSSEGVRIE